jgi:hypothetical protein
MTLTTNKRRSHLLLLGLVTLSMLTALPRAQAYPLANRFRFVAPVFQSVWAASDQAVANGSVARSYTWGPTPWFDYKEYYRQSPNSLRQVQYFDKSRMEINDPGVSTERGVTNGLLTVELVSGRLKVGNNIGAEDNVQRQPASVPVAGDPGNVNPNAPTYATFQGVATIDNGYRDADRTGQRTGTTLDKIGNRTDNATLSRDPATEIVAYNTVTGHNVPRVFRDFLQNGPVDALFAFGYPITDPYWIRARVAGVEKDIFVQLYERRVVTYTPSNPAGFQVEMGNVGQHYFQWRYPHLGQPWQPQEGFNLPIVFASRRATADHWEVFSMDTNGNGVDQITSGQQETVPYSWRHSFTGGDTPRLMTDSRRVGGQRQLFSIGINDDGDVRQHTNASGGAPHVFNGAVSPDGLLIAAVVNTNDFQTLALLPFNREQMFVSTIAPSEQGCLFQSPSWLPDGSGLIYAASCKGKLAIYRADLIYYTYPNDDYVGAQITNVRDLTNTPTVDNYFPRLSPDGRRIVFSSNRDGDGDLYVINVDGTGERRLTSGTRDDGSASWSPDGTEIVFDSNRDGDYELYKMNVQTMATTQLTFNEVDDRWPVWYQ